ncbi:hypothetical protein MPT09_003325 [Salmonella enterica]|nr:hypothetical protein [Salmonella enterica]EDP0789268.1 hypothetical protein [Salmonella enterica]EHF7572026.1 hypothetical protein [Salmonella enterica]EIZ5185221.1 hypothetical protein [Salmonella enterica]
MFSIIYHAGAAVLFLVMSLAAGAGLLLHGHEYTTGHFWNMAGLCIVSCLVWIWAVMQAKEAWYISRSSRNEGQVCNLRQRKEEGEK